MGQFLEKPKTEKHNASGKSQDLRYGLGSMQGWRVDMEDAHATVLQLDEQRWSQWSYFGIFDGHAGYRTAIKSSEKLHQRILTSLNSLVQDSKMSLPITSSQLDYSKFEMAIKDAYFKFDQEWREENRNQNPDDKSGSTAISCLIDSERVYFLNVGDSRGILVSNEGRILLATKDHKPSDQAERQRIQEAGGTVLIQRVNGSLAVSRALGDFEYKNNPNRRPDQQLVSPEPEISYYNRTKIDETIAFIVLACDGIWDVMTNEELATFILGRMHVIDDLTEIANNVLDMCLFKGSKDNMSLIIIAFPSAPVAETEWKRRDEELDTEIRKKTIEILNRIPNKNNVDVNTVWQQVMTSLNDQPSIRDALPLGGGFLAKRWVFEQTFESVTKGNMSTTTNTNSGVLIVPDEQDDEHLEEDEQSRSSNSSTEDRSPSSTSNTVTTLTQ